MSKKKNKKPQTIFQIRKFIEISSDHNNRDWNKNNNPKITMEVYLWEIKNIKLNNSWKMEKI